MSARTDLKAEARNHIVPKILFLGAKLGDDDGRVHLGTVGSRILGAVPDLDPRTYGCGNLSTLATQPCGFEIRKGPGKAIHIPCKAVAGKSQRLSRRVSGRCYRRSGAGGLSAEDDLTSMQRMLAGAGPPARLRSPRSAH